MGGLPVPALQINWHSRNHLLYNQLKMKKLATYTVYVVAGLCVIFTVTILFQNTDLVNTYAYQKGLNQGSVQGFQNGQSQALSDILKSGPVEIPFKDKDGKDITYIFTAQIKPTQSTENEEQK